MIRKTIKGLKQTIEAEQLAGINEIIVLPLVKLETKLKTGNITLSGVREEVEKCQRCVLAKTRTNVVFGEGSIEADLMFIGEAPVAQEDRQARPFVGEAGQLLTKIIESIGLKREEVFIANILKCRPPGNRNPLPGEIAECSGYLYKQIKLIRPKVICGLGKFASQTLLKSDVPISRLRGKFYDYNGIKLMPTYHPAYLLRNPSGKKEVWKDMKMIAKELGLEIPKRK
ncbi:MAG: uracil-DNA glycosylase [Candidatus Omnitrophota bacterium]